MLCSAPMYCSLTADWQNLRTRLDILLGHFLVTRGETRRAAELADLSLLQWPKHHGPTPCFAVVMKMSNGKTNKFWKIEYMGAMRHKDPMLCTMGAAAQYLFWRWHCSGETTAARLVRGESSPRGEAGWQDLVRDTVRVYLEGLCGCLH